MSDSPVFDQDGCTLKLGGARVVFHCHHYNVFLQRSIEDALGADAIELQREAAAEAARGMLTALFADAPGASLPDKLARAAALFGSLGFGRADVSGLSAMGGEVRVSPSHYAIGWSAKWGAPPGPVDHFATGFFRGALCAATGHAPERVKATEAPRDERGTIVLLEVR